MYEVYFNVQLDERLTLGDLDSLEESIRGAGTFIGRNGRSVAGSLEADNLWDLAIRFSNLREEVSANTDRCAKVELGEILWAGQHVEVEEVD